MLAVVLCSSYFVAAWKLWSPAPVFVRGLGRRWSVRSDRSEGS